MTYEQALEFINQSNQYGCVPGLETITELMNRLDNPQEKLKIIHVGGTNGKGSVSSFITGILSAAGYRVGRYISPAVFSYRERIQIVSTGCSKRSLLDHPAEEIQTEFISEQGVCDTIGFIKPICEKMVAEGLSHPTSFEIETAMTMLYLLWEKVDFTLLEVGLGGRLDATNVIKNPVCSVITSISMDHMQYLGNTLELIAGEKAGIIKKGSPLVTCAQRPEVVKVLENVCRKNEVPLIVVDPNRVTNIKHNLDEITFSIIENIDNLFNNQKDNLVNKTINKSINNRLNNSINSLIYSVDNPVNNAIDYSTNSPTNNSTNNQVDNSTNNLNDVYINSPINNLVYSTLDNSIDDYINSTKNNTVHIPVDNSIDGPINYPLNKLINNLIDNPSENEFENPNRHKVDLQQKEIVEQKEIIQQHSTSIEHHNKVEQYQIKLLGEHQVGNAVLAIEVAKLLDKLGYDIKEEHIKQGLSHTKWSGRFEIVDRNPYVILDGAHNEDAAIALINSIRLYFTNRRIIYIIGVLSDKDYESILKYTAPLADIIITLTPDNHRALSSSELAKAASRYGKRVIDAGNVTQALEQAYLVAGEEDVIIAFGSLSFLGDLIRNIRIRKDDRS